MAGGVLPGRAADPPGPAVDPLLAEAFSALDAAGLVWALLRGRDELAGHPDDVDLLMAAPDPSTVDRALAGRGWVRLPASGRGAHRFWFRYDSAGDRWLKLDVVDGIELGPWHQHPLGLAAALLEHRRHDGAVWRLRDGDERWLRLLHELYDKDSAPAAQRWATGLSVDGPVPAAFDRLAGAGAAARLLAGQRPDAPGGGKVATRHRLARRLHSGRRWPIGRGRVLQVLGPDGAGKSTLVAALVRDLPVDTAGVYMGLWRESAVERRMRPVPGATTAVRLGRAARMSALARLQVARGRLVVLDRSPYDALLGDADRSLGGRLLAACALRWAPDPFLVVLLDAPGEVLYARTPEHPPEVLERRRQDYLIRHPQALVLDATASRDAVRRAALAGVWDRLARSVRR